MTASTSDPRLVSLADPRLAALVDELTDRLQAGEAVDLEAFIGRYPERADQVRQLIPALELIGELKRSAGRETASAPSPGRDPRLEAGVLGDYRILREVGRGGMGVVYEAEQVSLGRRVALKVLPLAAALDSKRLQRFQVEAQAAACLHHTNIVPVHTIGCERGVPFYAMQFIEGRSLAQLIAELRRLEGLDAAEPPAERLVDISTSALAASLVSGGLVRGTGRPLAGGTTAPLEEERDEPEPTMLVSRPEPDSSTRPSGGELTSTRGREYIRTVAQLGVQVAEALDHAHTRGILHRDIKPANLLLDDQGQLWVTDFGLAQIQGNPGVTLTGDILGTLRYMSPEQALAKRVVIDGRTDIYSLGVTLYELLTLRPAFDGQDRQEVLRKIAQEEPAPPRKLNPAIPRDLETIVLKAMAKEPAGRYPMAKELAEELRRFLEHRPIVSRPPSRLDRAAKWARRHRYAVWSGSVTLAALLGLSVVGLAVSNVLISREKDRKDAALREKVLALREREAALAAVEVGERQAQTNLRLARKAVDGLYTQLAEELYALPRMQPLQRKLLLQALEFYKEFSAQEGSDPEVRFETGRAYRRVGSIEHLLGQRPEASQALRRAITLLETLTQEFPDEAKYQTELASAYSTLGFTLLDTGETRPGNDAYRRATELIEQLASESPAATDSRERLSVAYRRLGTLPGISTPEAERALRRAARICEDLVAQFPNEPPYRADLISSLANLAYVLAGSGRHGDAEKAFREVIAIYEAGGTSVTPIHRRELLVTLNRELASVLIRAGRAEDAVGVLRRAIALYEQVSAGSADAAGNPVDLTSTYRSLSVALQRARRPVEAIEAFERTLKYHDVVTKRSPGDMQRPLGKADLLNELGRMLAEEHRPTEAKGAFQKASEICERLAAQIPNDPSIGRDFQAECYFQWTRAIAPLGRQRDAVETARKAVELYASLAAQRSDGPASQEAVYQWRLAVSSHLLGAALAATGSPQEAADAYRRAAALRPDRALFNNDLAWFLIASKDPPAHDPAEAVALARRARDIEPTAAHIWNTLGVAHYRAGEYRAAIAALEKSEELGHGREFGFNAFFLALSRWQLGERDLARRW